MKKRVPLFLSAVLATAAVVAAPAGAVDREPTIENPIIIESFDGEPIVATLMLPADASASAPVPVIFQTHGWGGTRAIAPAGVAGQLLEKGYAILTWDSRGFGDSGGEANIDYVEIEVKDAQALIDYAAARPEILKDRPGDPRMGWIGGSYAGAIQLNTAANDKRVDAIVPEIAWGNLVQDLFPNSVIKRNWTELLYGAGQTAVVNGADSPAGPQSGNYAPEIHEAEVTGSATGEISPKLLEWFGARSTSLQTPKITAPTMFVQGTIDTLFPLEDAMNGFRTLTAKGVPTKLLAYCGGHTVTGCTYPGGTTGRPDGADLPSIYETRVIAWLDRYVKRYKVNTGPKVEWQAQDGYYYGAPSFPLPKTRFFTAPEALTGMLFGPDVYGGDGPDNAQPAPAQSLGFTAERSEIMTATKPVSIVGIPRVTIDAAVTGALGGNIYLKLIDRDADGNLVGVDNQTMPVKLAGDEQGRVVAMHGVSWLLLPGHTLMLEVTTGSLQYDHHRYGPYLADISVTASVPVAPAPTYRAK